MQQGLTRFGILCALFGCQTLYAGAACVVAKKLGDSQAIEWIAEQGESGQSAIDKARQRLKQQGFVGKYQDAHTQAVSDLPHAHVVIVTTTYETRIGKSRTSYGCGFSAHSVQHATELALYNLRNYSWGWKPELGYRIEQQLSY